MYILLPFLISSTSTIYFPLSEFAYPALIIVPVTCTFLLVFTISGNKSFSVLIFIIAIPATNPNIKNIPIIFLFSNEYTKAIDITIKRTVYAQGAKYCP